MSKSMSRLRIRSVLGFGFIIPFLALFWNVYAAATICFALSCMFWITNIGEVRNSDGALSLQDRIKRRLGVEHMVIWMRKKPMKKVAFGGFAIPVMPVFVTAGFNENISKVETTIHELVHAYYFIYGFQSFVLYAFVALVTSVRMNFAGVVAAVGFVICYMLFQEYIAFNLTQKIAVEYGYSVRAWNRYVFIKYVIYYCIWFAMCLGIFFVYFMYSRTTGILVAIAGFLIFNRVMLKISSFFNRRDKQNNKLYKYDKLNKLESSKN